MKLIKQFTLLVTILLFAACARNTEEIELKLNLNVGDSQTIIASTDTSQGTAVSLKDRTEVKFAVSEATENSYTYNVDVIRIKSETKMMGEVDRYDSDKKLSRMTTSEIETHNEFKDYLESEFQISLDHRGKVTQPLSKMNGYKLEFPIVDMSNVQLVLPESKVRVGSTWKGEKTNEFTDQIIKTTYEIEDITSNEVEISFVSIIPAFSGLLGENKAYGDYRLNRQTGTLIKGTLKMDLQTGGSVTKTYEAK